MSEAWDLSGTRTFPRSWKIAGGLWLLLLVVAGAFSWRELARGRLDTDLFALIPAEQDNLLKRAMSAGRGDLLFWVHPANSSETSLDPALVMLEGELQRSGLFVSAHDERTLLAALQTYRFQMLSSSDRMLLLRGGDDQVAQQGLEQLASPMPAGQFAALPDDPLGTFERAMLERVQARRVRGIVFAAAAGFGLERSGLSRWYRCGDGSDRCACARASALGAHWPADRRCRPDHRRDPGHRLVLLRDQQARCAAACG